MPELERTFLFFSCFPLYILRHMYLFNLTSNTTLKKCINIKRWRWITTPSCPHDVKSILVFAFLMPLVTDNTFRVMQSTNFTCVRHVCRRLRTVRLFCFGHIHYLFLGSNTASNVWGFVNDFIRRKKERKMHSTKFLQ